MPKKNENIRFTSIKLPLSSPPNRHHFFSSLNLTTRTKFHLPINFQPPNFLPQFLKTQSFIRQIITNNPLDSLLRKPPRFCSASIALSDTEPETGDDVGAVTHSKSLSSNNRAKEERVLISKVFVRDKDGEQLERKDLEAEALNALKAS